MTLDLTQLLIFLGNFAWDRSTAMDLAHRIAEGADLVVDHDAGAGESWLRLLRGDQMVGMIHLVRNLVVVDPQVSISARGRDGIAVLLSIDLTARILTTSQDAIERAFPGRSRSAVLEGSFAFEDLWFATV